MSVFFCLILFSYIYIYIYINITNKKKVSKKIIKVGPHIIRGISGHIHNTSPLRVVSQCSWYCVNSMFLPFTSRFPILSPRSSALGQGVVWGGNLSPDSSSGTVLRRGGVGGSPIWVIVFPSKTCFYPSSIWIFNQGCMVNLNWKSPSPTSTIRRSFPNFQTDLSSDLAAIWL